MVTENDEVLKKIRGTADSDWRLQGFNNHVSSKKVVVLESGMIQIDPRFTSHC